MLAGFGGEERIARLFLREFSARIPDALEFAVANRVLLVEVAGVGVDVSLAALPFEEEMVARATGFAFIAGQELRICTAEDLIILKSFAARPQDWVDVQNVITRQSALDWDYIMPRITGLAELKEEPELVARHLADAVARGDDSDTVAAMRLIWAHLKLIVEPSAAIALAAILCHRDVFAGGRIGVILSGGNVDLDALPW